MTRLFTAATAIVVLARGALAAQQVTFSSSVTVDAVPVPTAAQTPVAGATCGPAGDLAMADPAALFLCHDDGTNTEWRLLMPADPCGNGVLDVGEECDSTTASICSATCTFVADDCLDFNPSGTGAPTSNKYVQLSAQPFEGHAAATMETWVYVRQYPVKRMSFFWLGNGVLMLDNDGRLDAMVNKNRDFYNGAQSEYIANCGDPLPLNTWVHVALVVEGTDPNDFADDIKLFVDGVLISSSCPIGRNNAFTSDNYISDVLGSHSLVGSETGVNVVHVNDRFWDGMMGHYLRGWTVAKTAEEIQAGMFEQFPHPTANLALNFRVDLSSDVLGLFDEVTPGSPGVLNGGVAFCPST